MHLHRYPKLLWSIRITRFVGSRSARSDFACQNLILIWFVLLLFAFVFFRSLNMSVFFLFSINQVIQKRAKTWIWIPTVRLRRWSWLMNDPIDSNLPRISFDTVHQSNQCWSNRRIYMYMYEKRKIFSSSYLKTFLFFLCSLSLSFALHSAIVFRIPQSIDLLLWAIVVFSIHFFFCWLDPLSLFSFSKLFVSSLFIFFFKTRIWIV